MQYIAFKCRITGACNGWTTADRYLRDTPRGIFNIYKGEHSDGETLVRFEGPELDARGLNYKHVKALATAACAAQHS